jgi:site-specific recombinase
VDVAATAPVDALPVMLSRMLPGGDPDWLGAMLRWLKAAPSSGAEGPPPRTIRLRALARAIAEHPQGDELRLQVQRAFGSASVVHLLADSGIPVETSMGRELVRRLGHRLLPRPSRETDVPEQLMRLDLTESDARWVGGLEPSDMHFWTPLVTPPAGRWMEAAQVIAVRASAAGISPELFELAGRPPMGDSPFLQLGPAIATAAASNQPATATEWQAELRNSQGAMSRIEARLDRGGISTEAVFRIEQLSSMLARLGILMTLATRSSRGEGQRFAAGLVRALAQQNSLRGVVATASGRLSRKIVEHTGDTGEDYVARDRPEWRDHFRRAAWGGAVVVITALLKFGVLALPFAPLWLGVALSLNYAINFVFMQLNHYILASRQPSMTAAALAKALEKPADYGAEIELVAGITRSQVASVLGNLLVIIPLALVMDLAMYRLTGQTIIDPISADHYFVNHQPFRSFVLPYACVTGLFLWLSSLAAGWATNWSTYRQLPDALRQDPRVSRVLGKAGARQLARAIEHNIGGIAGYVTLGFLLGLVPVVFSKFLGIALDVPHVSLSSAFLSFSVLPRWTAGEFAWWDIGKMGLAILLVGTINIAVSFVLALRTAMRARGLVRGQRQGIFRALRGAFAAHPSRFLWRAPKQADYFKTLG